MQELFASWFMSCVFVDQVRLANISTDGACSGTKKIAQHHGSAHKIALQPFSSSVFLSCGEDGNVFLVDTRLER